jgi:FkbH-like protein
MSVYKVEKIEKSIKSVKCVVWDLDNTLWDGVLLEDKEVSLRPEVVDVIKTLDSRGILNSIASKNDYATAEKQLELFGLREYFLYPQINWNSKASSLKEIAHELNIGLDSFAFIDDQPFEYEEVAFSIPEVLCIDAYYIPLLLNMPEMNPRFVTEDSKHRRLMYLSDRERMQVEKDFVGTNDAFLATLNMLFSIVPAQEEDLQRAEELTVRTHQLNTTGYTYSYDELRDLITSPSHQLFIASLDDKYGPYGKIGLALVEKTQDAWNIKLLLMSCRVMSRGVGTIMLTHIMNLAHAAGVRLLADFVPTDRNRLMYITYRFIGFKEVQKQDNLITFEHSLERIPPFPDYIQVFI